MARKKFLEITDIKSCVSSAYSRFDEMVEELKKELKGIVYRLKIMGLRQNLEEYYKLEEMRGRDKVELQQQMCEISSMR